MDFVACMRVLRNALAAGEAAVVQLMITGSFSRATIKVEGPIEGRKLQLEYWNKLSCSSITI